MGLVRDAPVCGRRDTQQRIRLLEWRVVYILLLRLVATSWSVAFDQEFLWKEIHQHEITFVARRHLNRMNGGGGSMIEKAASGGLPIQAFASQT